MPPEPDVAAKALAAACEAVRPGEAGDAIGGIIPPFVAAPSSTAEASALLRAAAELELAVVPRGSGSRLHWGTPPSRCDLVVDTLRMSAVTEHAAGDLVARVQAGARMGDVEAVLAVAGQEIALDVPPSATVGGVIADALAGPRRLRYGSPRDLLIGITVVRADGIVARSGGKVVKNVAGYDLGKLFCGSAGTLGLITEATFRLHPLPAARAWVTAEFPGAGDTSARGVAAAANSPLVASAVELSRPVPGGPVSVSVLLEGSAGGVAARAERVAGLLSPAVSSVSATAPGWWGAIPALDGDAATVLRVTFWVSALAAILDAIDDGARETGTRPLVHGSAGAGVLYVALPAGTSAGDAGRLAAIVRDAVPRGRGSCQLMGNPARANGIMPGAGLMRAVKDQFDPGGRMSPGRFTG